MKINLIVIRTTDIKILADFYQLLGLQFAYHRHGNGPFHYSADVEGTVLEIYPLSKEQTGPDLHLRLGFRVDDFEAAIHNLQVSGVTFTAWPKETEYGTMAIVTDPDGRKVELYKK